MSKNVYNMSKTSFKLFSRPWAISNPLANIYLNNIPQLGNLALQNLAVETKEINLNTLTLAYCFTVLYLRPWMGFYRLHPVNYSYLIANKSTIHVLGDGSEFRIDGDPDEN
jgi:hypothetical protein